jgi:hypothetical protein
MMVHLLSISYISFFSVKPKDAEAPALTLPKQDSTSSYFEDTPSTSALNLLRSKKLVQLCPLMSY